MGSGFTVINSIYSNLPHSGVCHDPDVYTL